MKLVKAGIPSHLREVTLDKLPEALHLTVRLDYSHFDLWAEVTRREVLVSQPMGPREGTHHVPEPVDIEFGFMHKNAHYDDDVISLRCLLGLTAESDEEAGWLKEPSIYAAKVGPRAHFMILDPTLFQDVLVSSVSEPPHVALRGDPCGFATVSVNRLLKFQ